MQKKTATKDNGGQGHLQWIHPPQPDRRQKQTHGETWQAHNSRGEEDYAPGGTDCRCAGIPHLLASSGDHLN